MAPRYNLRLINISFKIIEHNLFEMGSSSVCGGHLVSLLSTSMRGLWILCFSNSLNILEEYIENQYE
jgi:hypothetical protein